MLIRMSFGLNITCDAFQYKLDSIVNGLDLCTGIADDRRMLDGEVDGNDHDKHLTKFL